MDEYVEVICEYDSSGSLIKMSYNGKNIQLPEAFKNHKLIEDFQLCKKQEIIESKISEIFKYLNKNL